MGIWCDDCSILNMDKTGREIKGAGWELDKVVVVVVVVVTVGGRTVREVGNWERCGVGLG